MNNEIKNVNLIMHAFPGSLLYVKFAQHLYKWCYNVFQILRFIIIQQNFHLCLFLDDKY